MKSAIGLLMAPKRSDAENAESGRPRATSTRNADTKMGWQHTVKNVQIKLQIGPVGGGWL